MSKQPVDPPPRKPAAFAIEPEPASVATPRQNRPPGAFAAPVTMTEEKDDPFSGVELDVESGDLAIATPRRRGFSWSGLALTATSIILSLAIGVWIDQLISDLFNRSDLLGYLAIGATALLVLAVLVMVGSEMFALRRLAEVRTIKSEAEEARRDRRPAPARAVVARLVALIRSRPETARGREILAATEGEIVDGAGLLELAETELLVPLDLMARRLVLASAKRVSIVTAVSPRALVDLFYVLYESARLIRAIAEIYGTRPGRLGFIRLFGDVISHLAVTGSIAVGDSLVQQFIGHGLASRLSARLGEGVINGLMTARIGIAAIDLCRPLAFHATRRPGIGDFIGDIAKVGKGSGAAARP